MEENEFLYGSETYKLRGILFAVHNELGRFAKEKQYQEKAEERLKLKDVPYLREPKIGDLQDTPDFIVWNNIILEFKAKPFLQRDDFEQVQRYLQQTNLKLGILVNFRAKYLKPQRILKIKQPSTINHLQVSVKSDPSVDRNT